MNQASTFKIVIKDFQNGGDIPIKYTPYGIDVNPEVDIIGIIPSKAKSLAFVVQDPDAPKGIFYHWLVKDIQTNIKSIPQNTVPGTQVTNSWGIKSYKGPQPPSGSHRYYFTIYVLDIKTFTADSPQQFMNAMKGHIIEEQSYMGKFSHR